MGTCLPLDHIVGEDCGANPGGTTELYAIRRRDILTFPEPDEEGSLIISDPIVPKTGKGFVKIDFATDTGDLNHKSGGDAGNQSVSMDQNLYVPRGNPVIDKTVNAMLNGDYVTISRDATGQLQIGGDKYRGLKFDYDYKKGKKGSDKNGSDLKFAGEGFSHLPYYYEAAIPMLPVTP